MEVAGVRGRMSVRRGRKAAELNAKLRVFGNWKTWWRKRVRTQIAPRRVSDMSGTWDQRLVRLAVVQQLRAAYGIKVKGGRAQCDRRRQETATTEIVVSSGERGLDFKRDRGGGWCAFCTIAYYQVMLKCSFCMDPREYV